MANYPDWVMKHKRKGTYVNKVGEKYYLYAAHSQRVKGTEKVKRVCDGYLGRITPEGFIPPKKKLSGDLLVYEYGLTRTILTLTEGIRLGLKKSYKRDANYIFVCAALTFMHGHVSKLHYETSWISKEIPRCNVTKESTLEQQSGIERTVRMIKDVFVKRFGEDTELALSILPLVHKVCMVIERPKSIEEKIEHIPELVKDFIDKHNLHIEGVEGA